MHFVLYGQQLKMRIVNVITSCGLHVNGLAPKNVHNERSWDTWGQLFCMKHNCCWLVLQFGAEGTTTLWHQARPLFAVQTKSIVTIRIIIHLVIVPHMVARAQYSGTRGAEPLGDSRTSNVGGTVVAFAVPPGLEKPLQH